jgi:hypothetical protein
LEQITKLNHGKSNFMSKVQNSRQSIGIGQAQFDQVNKKYFYETRNKYVYRFPSTSNNKYLIPTS